ncbi:MAG: MotA/TolQ/ExbB proton channel family protein [Candidatus Hydrogenedentes bacterium]|nr:MotA/TolQ/ExbB proton channel family protein [Candidatus Hydrogenedentota bacterium]
MDPITVGGIVLAVCAVLGTALLEGLHLHSLVSESSFVLIFFGTTGATIACFTLRQVINTLKALPMLIKKANMDVRLIIEAMNEISTMAKRDGLLSLENYKPKVDHPTLQQGIRLMVDGTPPQLVKEILEMESYLEEEEMKGYGAVFAAAGGFAPTYGIIGTVMGLVHVLGNLEDASSLGPAIAVAFLATLYGIGAANIFFLPMSKKFGTIAKEQTMVRDMIIEGILSIYNGETPTVVKLKMMSFIGRHEREAMKAGR